MHSTINAKGSKRMVWQNVITCICLRQVMIDHLHFYLISLTNAHVKMPQLA